MMLTFGPYSLDVRERSLSGPAGPIELSARSVDLLKVLLQRPNELVSKSDLLDAVWPGVVVEENTLQVHISALRKALGDGYVTTVHGRGYRYAGPPAVDGQAFTAQSGGAAGNLSRYQMDCVARDGERSAARELLGRQRLVTILGPGGIGKTTLALAVAADVAAAFPGGVWVIDLAALADASLVESAVIQTLGIPFRANATASGLITDHLRQRDVLLVLDNCEHVAGAVARLAKALLVEAPALRILATSQVPLGIAGETVFRLTPFTIEGSDAQSAQFLAHCYEALGERLTPEELPIVARLCRRLDGVALALKMAAARAATLGIATVDRQIEEQLAGLSAGWQTDLARHQSLTASLTWSYELLAEGDRRTLRALGVFLGTFTLEGVRAVAGPGADDSLSELVRRSIVVRDGSDRSRYRLLETTRHFALAQLAEASEEVAVRDRHAGHVRNVFMRGLDEWETTPDRAWLTPLQLEVDNLRSALEWTRVRADWPGHLALAACSYRFWIQTELPDEGLRHADGAATHLDEAPAETRALLGLALGELYRFYWRDHRVLRYIGPVIEYFEQTDNRVRLVQALALQGWSQINVRDLAAAGLAFSRMDALAADMPQSKIKARGLVLGAMYRWMHGDEAVGRAKLEAGLAMHVATGNIRGHWKSVMLSAELLHQRGDTLDAIDLVLRVLPELRAHATSDEHADQVDNLCVYYMSIGDYEAARPLITECASVMPRDGDKSGMWCLTQNAAELLAHDGKPAAATLLLGYVDACFSSWEDGRQVTEAHQRERILRLVNASGMPEAEIARLMAQGAAMSPFEAELLAGLKAGN